MVVSSCHENKIKMILFWQIKHIFGTIGHVVPSLNSFDQKGSILKRLAWHDNTTICIQFFSSNLRVINGRTLQNSSRLSYQRDTRNRVFGIMI